MHRADSFARRLQYTLEWECYSNVRSLRQSSVPLALLSCLLEDVLEEVLQSLGGPQSWLRPRGFFRPAVEAVNACELPFFRIQAAMCGMVVQHRKSTSDQNRTLYTQLTRRSRRRRRLVSSHMKELVREQASHFFENCRHNLAQVVRLGGSYDKRISAQLCLLGPL